jgi:hypothetical protein
MSSRSRRARERIDSPLPEPGPSIIVDAWSPDYGRECVVCGAAPCVTGVKGGRVVYEAEMCGVCTWGEAACLDPLTGEGASNDQPH